jgi:ATP-dependent helicase/nuclease subunit B
LNRLQEALSDVCTKERLREKILLAPSFSSGHQIAESIVRLGVPYLNLRINTLRSLALDIVAVDLAREAITLLSDTAMLMIIEDIFNELKEKNDSYFHNMATKEGIVAALAAAVNELRMNGVRSDTLIPEQFISERKGTEIKKMLWRYEALLRERKFADSAEILTLACENLRSGNASPDGPMYLVLSDASYAAVEKRFIEALQSEKRVLPHDIPSGLSYPSRYLSLNGGGVPRKPGANIDLMPWLFDPGSAPSSFIDDTVGIFHAVGRRNEVREVFRRALAAGARSDQVEIICTSYNDYVPLVYGVAEKFGIGITVEEGLPVTFTRPGRAVLGLISWIASGYEASKFRHLLTSGSLDLKADGVSGDPLSVSIMGRILRESGIGWSRERYLPCLEEMAESYASRAREKEEEEESLSEFYLKKEANARFLVDRTKEILDSIPVEDGNKTVSLSEFCRAVMIFINNYARISNELDGEARVAVVARLEEAASLSSRKVPYADALNRIEMMVREVRVGASGPSAGCIHLSSYRCGGRSGRPHTFVVGCDSLLFPGIPVQNPVLLDEEAGAIGAGLPQSSEHVKENLYRMTSLLASLSGQVIFSFSSFDVLENRESFPSSVLLQVHRLVSGKPEADYSDLMAALGAPSGYVPSISPLDDLDFWIRKFLGADGIRKAEPSTIALYPGLSEGLRAIEARKSGRVTEYDGKIRTISRDLDPRENSGLVMSASMIEKLAACPFSYLLYYVLKVRPLDEVTVEKGEWLDALQRGKLLHELFYEFMTEITKKKEKPSVKLHGSIINRMAERLIKKCRELVPPPGEAVYEQEKIHLLKVAQVFLKVEEEHCRNCTPLFFELAFGMGGETLAGQGIKEPVGIPLGNGKSFRLRGRIDRVDKVDGHDYDIWDYKTGSTYGFPDNACFSKGKVLQHALYAIAAEIILKQTGVDKSASVRRSGYFFPSEKGAGKRLSRSRNDDALSEILNALFDIVKAGVFLPSDDNSSCTYCDYGGVCGADATHRTSAKLENSDNAELCCIREVKNHD